MKNKKEYFVYTEDGELEDVISFTNKEALKYSRENPTYTLEEVESSYSEYSDEE